MLVAFDFDGTLSDSEMTVLLGQQNGTAEDMATITERAMNDEIEYAESLRQRCALLADVDDDLAQEAFDQVRLRPGAADVIEALRAAGHYVTVLTGGFERGVEAALEHEDVTVDSIVANRLLVEDGTLTGDVRGPHITGTKDNSLEVVTSVVDADPDETVAIGDGANDLPMLQVASLAIGFDPKPAVEPACHETVETMGELADLLEAEEIL
jgi:phosphoserine phosphatase